MNFILTALASAAGFFFGTWLYHRYTLWQFKRKMERFAHLFTQLQNETNEAEKRAKAAMKIFTRPDRVKNPEHN